MADEFEHFERSKANYEARKQGQPLTITSPVIQKQVKQMQYIPEDPFSQKQKLAVIGSKIMAKAFRENMLNKKLKQFRGFA